MNTMIISGNATAKGDLRYTSGGTAVLSFTIGNNERISKDKEATLFMNCVLFGKRAETIVQYIEKGTRLLVQGRVEQDNWVDKNGNRRTSYNLIVDKLDFMGCKNSSQTQKPVVKPKEEKEENIPTIDVDSDDIPF